MFKPSAKSMQRFFKTVKAEEEALQQEQVISTLQSLLMDEYQQRDLYESYDYLFFGLASSPIQEHLREHAEQEMDHARVLQRYLVAYGAIPTLERKPIPVVEPLSFEGILQKDLELEHAAVENYTQMIKMLEGDDAYTALRVDLENIIIQEQEHVHDLSQWLREYN